MTEEEKKEWARLMKSKKYCDIAGMAYEYYLRDPNKGKTHPIMYFKFAGLRTQEIEVRYQKGLGKYRLLNQPVLEST